MESICDTWWLYRWDLGKETRGRGGGMVRTSIFSFDHSFFLYLYVLQIFRLFYLSTFQDPTRPLPWLLLILILFRMHFWVRHPGPVFLLYQANKMNRLFLQNQKEVLNRLWLSLKQWTWSLFNSSFYVWGLFSVLSCDEGYGQSLCKVSSLYFPYLLHIYILILLFITLISTL